MIFDTRQDQRFNFHIAGHKIDISTDFKYLGVILAEIDTSTKLRNIMLGKLGRQCMYFLKKANVSSTGKQCILFKDNLNLEKISD